MNPLRSPQKNRSIFVGRDRGKVRRIGRSTPPPLPPPPLPGRTGRSVLCVCYSAAYGLEFRTSCPRTRITVSVVVQKDCCVRKTERPYHVLENIKRFAITFFFVHTNCPISITWYFFFLRLWKLFGIYCQSIYEMIISKELTYKLKFANNFCIYIFLEE